MIPHRTIPNPLTNLHFLRFRPPLSRCHGFGPVDATAASTGAIKPDCFHAQVRAARHLPPPWVEPSRNHGLTFASPVRYLRFFRVLKTTTTTKYSAAPAVVPAGSRPSKSPANRLPWVTFKGYPNPLHATASRPRGSFVLCLPRAGCSKFSWPKMKQSIHGRLDGWIPVKWNKPGESGKQLANTSRVPALACRTISLSSSGGGPNLRPAGKPSWPGRETQKYHDTNEIGGWPCNLIYNIVAGALPRGSGQQHPGRRVLCHQKSLAGLTCGRSAK